MTAPGQTDLPLHDGFLVDNFVWKPEWTQVDGIYMSILSAQ